MLGWFHGLLSILLESTPLLKYTQDFKVTVTWEADILQIASKEIDDAISSFFSQEKTSNQSI